MWFELKGDVRLGQCDSEGCGGQPTYRFESHGVGSNYCSGCRERIEKLFTEPSEVTIRKMRDEWRT